MMILILILYLKIIMMCYSVVICYYLAERTDDSGQGSLPPYRMQ